jgi:hypothetical protein
VLLGDFFEDEFAKAMQEANEDEEGKVGHPAKRKQRKPYGRRAAYNQREL